MSRIRFGPTFRCQAGPRLRKVMMIEYGDTIQGILVPDGQMAQDAKPPAEVVQPLGSCASMACVQKHIGDWLGCGTLVG